MRGLIRKRILFKSYIQKTGNDSGVSQIWEGQGSNCYLLEEMFTYLI
jgi:hypothetical protein